MKRLTSIVVALILACLTLPASAIELGDKAPPLSIQTWVKGKQLSLEAGKGKTIFVVEFWATWCPPCRTSIPHLTELQKKYAAKDVVFIGISDEDLAKVSPFVKEMGEKMAYTVAVDAEHKTSKAYMEAFGVDSIPHAFIVNKEGKLIWHGHPMDGMEEVLAQVIDGKFNPETARQMEKARLSRQGIETLVKIYMAMVKMTEEQDLAQAVGARVLQKAKNEPIILNELAWTIVSDEEMKNPDLDLALKAIQQANTLTGEKDAGILDTYAVVLFKSGKGPEAKELIKKAIASCKNDDNKKELLDHQKRIEQGLAKGK